MGQRLGVQVDKSIRIVVQDAQPGQVTTAGIAFKAVRLDEVSFDHAEGGEVQGFSIVDLHPAREQVLCGLVEDGLNIQRSVRWRGPWVRPRPPRRALEEDLQAPA